MSDPVAIGGAEGKGLTIPQEIEQVYKHAFAILGCQDVVHMFLLTGTKGRMIRR